MDLPVLIKAQAHSKFEVCRLFFFQILIEHAARKQWRPWAYAALYTLRRMIWDPIFADVPQKGRQAYTC